jgi:hypothetical protein
LANYIFQDLAKKGKAEGIDKADNMKDARTWFRNVAQSVTSVNHQKMMQDKENIKNSITANDTGKMFMYFYDAKHKATLPYYDYFPLVFPLDFTPNGFLGINLHYLPPVLRAKLMDAIYNTINNQKYDDSTQLNISYSILKGASKYKYFQPCLKQYLWGHVASKFMNVEPKNWDMALMLPTERFRSNKTPISAQRVWKDSQGMVK